MNRTIIAIDPGASGGVACIIQNTASESCHSMWETEGDIIEGLKSVMLQSDGNPIAFVEEVGGFIGKPQPGSAMFKFGRGFGFILGVLQTLGFRVELVKPQKWQKELGLGTSSGMGKTEWKNKLKQRAQQLFPNCKVTLSTADALLILEYGRKTL